MRISTLSTASLLATAYAHELLLERELPPAVALNPDNYASCANAAWPPTTSDVGVELIPQAPDDELKALVDEVSSANIEATIEKLVSFGTRHTLSTQNSSTHGIGAARDWIASEMRKYAEESDGRMTVSVPGYIQGVATRIPFPVKISNVLATIKGSATPEKVYVMTGHYDSRVTDVLDYTSDAPGANDDASGTASMFSPSEITHINIMASTILIQTSCHGTSADPRKDKTQIHHHPRRRSWRRTIPLWLHLPRANPQKRIHKCRRHAELRYRRLLNRRPRPERPLHHPRLCARATLL
jgi:hypothetical protein